MPDYTKILYSIEVHSVEGIQDYFRQGGDPNEVHDGIPLFTTMVEMYTRTSRFKDCVKVFVDAGLIFEYKSLLAIFLDDAQKLEEIILGSPHVVKERFSIFKNTYTPLSDATLLHFCAEYNAINCAKLLIRHGADVNAKAGFDEYGFGGHTPIFHTVNQNSNNSMDMLNLLLEHSADLTITVKGLIWGRGYEWETWIPSVNPISYCMMGLLPQMHRKETTIASISSLLVKKAYGIDYIPANIPCAYLKH
ncbi:MAG TPA: ankyrin repeat domain-containing protein [Puia sp.]|nr:ankyrin repeat domain-containing protein [Puia sp.]